MNEIIRVESRDGVQYVNARDLHMNLGVGRIFAAWIKGRIDQYGFEEGVDFVTAFPDRESEMRGGQNRIEYNLTTAMAKELAIVENNEQGKRIRKHLIALEEAWNSPEAVMARALQVAERTLTRTNQIIAEMRPKAEFFDQVASSQDARTMRDVAAALNVQGWGRNKIFAFLREQGVLDDRNIPYREYQDRGYFRVVERSWSDPQGEAHVSLTTLVYQRGLDWIRRQIAKEGQSCA